MNVKWALVAVQRNREGADWENYLPDNGDFHIVLFLIVNTSYMETKVHARLNEKTLIQLVLSISYTKR